MRKQGRCSDVRMKVEPSPTGQTATTPEASSLPKTSISIEGAVSAAPKPAIEKVEPTAPTASKPEVVTPEIPSPPTPESATAKPSTPKPKVVVAPEPDAPVESHIESRQVAPQPQVEPRLQVDSQPKVVPHEQAAAQRPNASFESAAAHGAAVQESDAAAKEPPHQRATKARESVASWVRRTFPGHEHAFWGGVVALVVALLVFMIGLWRVLFIGIVVIIGIAIGQVFDGDPKMVNAIRSLFEGDRGQD